MNEKRKPRVLKKEVCRVCGAMYQIKGHKNNITICWKCNQKKKRADSSKSMRYTTDDVVYKTNKEKMEDFREEVKNTFPELEGLPSEEKERLLWISVIDSFEKKYGKLEDIQEKLKNDGILNNSDEKIVLNSCV